MALQVIYGDLFSEETLGWADAIINPVNTRGVQGAGVAKIFEELYPRESEFYKRWCKSSDARPGGICMMPPRDPSDIKVIHFATKDHWKEPSKIEYIRDGILELNTTAWLDCVTRIASPALGAGLGGLNFDDVVNTIEENLSDEIEMRLFRPRQMRSPVWKVEE